MVGIAQLVERLVVVQKVAGSSPVTHPEISSRELFRSKVHGTFFIHRLPGLAESSGAKSHH